MPAKSDDLTVRALTALAILATAAVLWAGGEQHRSNCIEQGHAGCSVLPWNAGHARRSALPAGLSPAERRALQREADAIAAGR